MLYTIIIVLASIIIGALVFLLIKQTERVKALEATELDLEARLEKAHGLVELVRLLRADNEQLQGMAANRFEENEQLRRDIESHTLSIELLVSELERTKPASGKRRAPQDRRSAKKAVSNST